MIIYIAGPMSGLPDHNHPAFNEAEKALRRKGFIPLNPARRPHSQGTWESYLKKDIIDILTHAEGIALLPRWEISKGAKFEHFVSTTLGIPAKPLREWLA